MLLVILPRLTLPPATPASRSTGRCSRTYPFAQSDSVTSASHSARDHSSIANSNTRIRAYPNCPLNSSSWRDMRGTSWALPRRANDSLRANHETAHRGIKNRLPGSASRSIPRDRSEPDSKKAAIYQPISTWPHARQLYANRVPLSTAPQRLTYAPNRNESELAASSGHHNIIFIRRRISSNTVYACRRVASIAFFRCPRRIGRISIGRLLASLFGRAAIGIAFGRNSSSGEFQQRLPQLRAVGPGVWLGGSARVILLTVWCRAVALARTPGRALPFMPKLCVRIQANAVDSIMGRFRNADAYLPALATRYREK